LPVYRAKVGHRKAPVIRRRINAIILARKRPRDAKSDRLLGLAPMLIEFFPMVAFEKGVGVNSWS
ncbi:hypothetical protein, partial [Methylocella sp.]|uniref:hypothetical protein n=1 Tax=Methylocella sp. TaxID=1978226 RepID=UPI003C15C81B